MAQIAPVFRRAGEHTSPSPETDDECFWRVARAVSDMVGGDDVLASEFHDLMAQSLFLPDDPVLVWAGRGVVPASVAVFAPEDSLDQAFDAVRESAMAQERGATIGVVFDRLRSAGQPCTRTSGRANGPFTWMGVFADILFRVKWRGHRVMKQLLLGFSHRDVLDLAKFDRPECGVAVAIAPSVLENLDAEVVVNRNLHSEEGFDSGQEERTSVRSILHELLPRVNVVFQGEMGCDCAGRFLAPGQCGIGGTVNLAACSDLEGLRRVSGSAGRFLKALGHDAAFLNVAGWREALGQRGIGANSEEAVAFASDVGKALAESGVRVAISEGATQAAFAWAVAPGLQDEAQAEYSLKVQAAFKAAGVDSVMKCVPVGQCTLDELVAIVQRAASLALSGVWFDRRGAQ